MPRLGRYLLRYRRAFVLGLLSVVLTTGIALASPLVLRYAVDDLTRGVTRAKLVEYGGLLLAIGLVGGVFRFQMRRVLMAASRGIEYDIRNDFFAHLERLPLSYFQQHRTGDLMSRATNDLSAVRMMIGPAVMYTANTGLTFVVAIAMMVSIDPRLTLWSLLPLPFVSISVKVFGSAVHRRFEQIQAQLSDLSAVVQESLAGVRVVRAYRQERAEVERFRRSNEEFLRRNRQLITIQGFFFPSMTFFLGLGALLVLRVGSQEVVRGRITIGQFVAFNAYLVMLSWPMIAFGWVTNMVQRGLASWKRMAEVLDATPAADIPAADGAPALRGAIEFRHLTFAYGAEPVLKDITATIAAGQTVALIGPTGSGKSTLVSLLARLYDPPRGAVFVDGVDVLDLPLAVLRGAVGMVPQEPFLFSDTIRANVLYGAPGGAAAEDAAAIARLDKDVEDFPKGYDTAVGERGITLSGGQKQRTALARAVAVDPRVLILDDALSAVDTYTEEEILGRLRAVLKARTAFIVSHRISTVRGADRIFVLADGRIVEQGTHEDLVRAGGWYADLHRKQLLEEELAAS